MAPYRYKGYKSSIKRKMKKNAKKLRCEGSIRFSSTIATEENARTPPDSEQNLPQSNTPPEDTNRTYRIENIESSFESGNMKNKEVKGRRIVMFPHFFNKLKEISNHGPLGCGLQSMEIISEKRIGFISKFTVICKMCHLKFFITNDNPKEVMNLNHCAAAGTLAIGCGHAQLEELTATLELPTITADIYNRNLDTVAKKIEDLTIQAMNVAAEEERELAIKEGRISKEGIPIIDVVADGCWGKRSYKKNYSSLSGAAAIVGRRTNKILYMSVKNKYCCICAQAENKKVIPKIHTCYKNYSGPSTGMESTLILEGFQQSVEMHNLIYGRIISDGDSNTYAKIIESRPYSNFTVEKIECRNHILRNLCNKLQALRNETKYPIKFRKLITKKTILMLRKVIVLAIQEYKGSSEADKLKNVTPLHSDIKISQDHAFGRHIKCKAYFCSKIGVRENIPEEFYRSAIWQRIALIVTNVAVHSRSLIHDFDSNVVERYHSVVAKYVGGKRINFSLKNQYKVRCSGAALSFNTLKPLSMLQESMVGNSFKGKINELEEKRMKRRKLLQKYIKKRRRLFTNKNDDVHYGNKCQKPDMSEDILEKSKKEFLDNLKQTSQNREDIMNATILQSGCSEWLELRRNMLTASNFGQVIKRRADISCSNLVKDLIYKSSIDHVKSVKHGRDNEKIAIDQLSIQEKIVINPCGLFIDTIIPYLGASPDGEVPEKDMIVEIKCPITAYKLGLQEAINLKKITFWKKTLQGIEYVNTSHNWYYQVQGQLHITQRSKCLFAIWYGENASLKTEIIERDDDFWKNKMENKLTKFYLDCILPELVDPRYTRNMKIRDPEYIQKAIALKKERLNQENIIPSKRSRDQENVELPPLPDSILSPNNSLSTEDRPSAKRTNCKIQDFSEL